MRRDATKSSKQTYFLLFFFGYDKLGLKCAHGKRSKPHQVRAAFTWFGYLFLGKATSHLGTIDWVYLVEATSLVQDGLRLSLSELEPEQCLGERRAEQRDGVACMMNTPEAN